MNLMRKSIPNSRGIESKTTTKLFDRLMITGMELWIYIRTSLELELGPQMKVKEGGFITGKSQITEGNFSFPTQLAPFSYGCDYRYLLCKIYTSSIYSSLNQKRKMF